MKYSYVLIFDWNYRGTPEQQYDRCYIQPYSKVFKDYLDYCCIGGPGADGVMINGYKTLKETLKHININQETINDIKFLGFDKRQKRHLHKILNRILKPRKIRDEEAI